MGGEGAELGPEGRGGLRWGWRSPGSCAAGKGVQVRGHWHSGEWWGGGGCAGSGGRSEGLRINSASAGLPPRPADSFVSPQALGLAGLVGEPEGEEEEEGEGPLCPETRFLRLSDGALLLRVLGIM